MSVNKQSSSFCGALCLLLCRLPISGSATEAKFLHCHISFPLPLPFSPTPIHVHSGPGGPRPNTPRHNPSLAKHVDYRARASPTLIPYLGYRMSPWCKHRHEHGLSKPADRIMTCVHIKGEKYLPNLHSFVCAVSTTLMLTRMLFCLLLISHVVLSFAFASSPVPAIMVISETPLLILYGFGLSLSHTLSIFSLYLELSPSLALSVTLPSICLSVVLTRYGVPLSVDLVLQNC